MLQWFKDTFTIFKSETVKVSPAVQKEIDRIVTDAKVRVSVLQSDHSLATIRAQYNTDVAKAFEVYTSHNVLLKAKFDADTAAATALIPNVANQLGVSAVASAV